LKVLFDTHTFLWAITDDQRLSSTAKGSFISSEVFLSVASVWEILVKAELGKLPLPHPAASYLRTQLRKSSIAVLPILLSHVLRLEGLPLHHRDPFDRIILAQAIEENIPIVGINAKFRQYPVEVLW